MAQILAKIVGHFLYFLSFFRHFNSQFAFQFSYLEHLLLLCVMLFRPHSIISKLMISAIDDDGNADVLSWVSHNHCNHGQNRDHYSRLILNVIIANVIDCLEAVADATAQRGRTISGTATYFHSQHLDVALEMLLPVSRCCISNCCRLRRKATSSFIRCLIWATSCCIWRTADHSCLKVGVAASSFSGPTKAKRSRWGAGTGKENGEWRNDCC